jgi:putative transposase
VPSSGGFQADLPPWRQLYGGMKTEEAKRFTQMEKEKARLKRPLAEADPDKAMLNDLAEGNF